MSVNLPDNSFLIYDNLAINKALDLLAKKLNSQLKNKQVVVLCVMQGGLIFSGQLIVKLEAKLEIDYIHATRYQNNTSGGELSWKAYPTTNLHNRVVLILDDILDEGKTLQEIIFYCKAQGASEIISAVLLKKNHQRCINNNLTDNIALTVEDKYVFGYGMDYHGQYRQLDSIYGLTEKGLK